MRSARDCHHISWASRLWGHENLRFDSHLGKSRNLVFGTGLWWDFIVRLGCCPGQGKRTAFSAASAGSIRSDFCQYRRPKKSDERYAYTEQFQDIPWAGGDLRWSQAHLGTYHTQKPCKLKSPCWQNEILSCWQISIAVSQENNCCQQLEEESDLCTFRINRWSVINPSLWCFWSRCQQNYRPVPNQP